MGSRAAEGAEDRGVLCALGELRADRIRRAGRETSTASLLCALCASAAHLALDREPTGRGLARDVDLAAPVARHAVAALRRARADLPVERAGRPRASTAVGRAASAAPAIGRAESASVGRTAAAPGRRAAGPADPVRRSGSEDARGARAAVGVVGALSARRDARRAGAHERGRAAVHGVRHARRAAAAVRARGARGARCRALSRRAPRDAHVVLLARVHRLAVAAAAVARRVARRRLQLANIAVGLAAHRVAADADGRRRRDVAGDRLSRPAGEARGAAAVAVVRAQVADDVAAARGLTDQRARRAPRGARAAAARAAARRQAGLVDREAAIGNGAAAELAVDDAAVGRSARRVDAARSEGRSHGDRARSRTAIRGPRAGVSCLPAERRGLARPVRAERRAAVAARRAGVAEGLARRVEGRARARHAALATALAVRGARRVVGAARGIPAHVPCAIAAAAVAGRRAPRAEPEAAPAAAAGASEDARRERRVRPRAHAPIARAGRVIVPGRPRVRRGGGVGSVSARVGSVDRAVRSTSGRPGQGPCTDDGDRENSERSTCTARWFHSVLPCDQPVPVASPMPPARVLSRVSPHRIGG